MGLEGTATRMIWLVAAVTATGSVMALSFDMLENDHKMTLPSQLAAMRLETRLDSGIFCYDPATQRLTVSARNAGDAMDLTNTTILVDGIPRAANTSVDGLGATPVWPAGEVGVWTIGMPQEPERVLIVTPHGSTRPVEVGSCPVLTTATITPSSATITAGKQQTFVVQGYAFSWTTNGGTVAAQSNTVGLLTASTTAASGRTVTATAGTVSVSATFEIIPDAPTSVLVSPNVGAVAAGGTRNYTAVVYDQYGNANATATVTWSTNAGSIASSGVLTAQTTPATGRTVTATVTANGVSGTADVDIVAGAPSTATVTPSSVTLLTGAQQTFTVALRDAYGNLNASAPVTWTATSGTITSAGVYTAPSATGSATVTATSGSAQGSATVTIVRETHVSAMGTYNGATPQTTFAKGTVVTTQVTIVDHNNVAVSGATVNIEIHDTAGVLRCNCSGVTDASGVAAIAYTLPNANLQGQWTIRTTLVTLPSTTYTPSANVVTTITFTET